MHDERVNASRDEDCAQMLRELRGHLTIAMLAAQHLHRSHPDAAPVAHLFTHLHTAHQQLVRDIEQVEAILHHVYDPHG